MQKEKKKKKQTKTNTPGLSAGKEGPNSRRKKFGQKNTWTEKTRPK